MAKQTKSKHRSVNTTPTAVPVVKQAKSAVKTMGKSFSAEFNPDYSYVVQDLKRIGTLAAIFFVVLVVLSFFLR